MNLLEHDRGWWTNLLRYPEPDRIWLLRITEIGHRVVTAHESCLQLREGWDLNGPLIIRPILHRESPWGSDHYSIGEQLGFRGAP